MIARNMFSLAALFLSSYWVSLVIALPYEKRDGSSPSDVAGNIVNTITVHKVIAGLLLIAIGLVYTFFGKRFFRITIFLLGLYVGAIITWTILINREPQNGYGSNSNTVILLSSLAVGLFVGSIFVCCANLAFWLLGALGGYALAVFILALRSGGLITSETGRIVFIIILVLAGGLLAVAFENIIIILSTAFIGALSVISGIDMFANTGFLNALQCFMDGNHDVVYNTSTKIYCMLLGVVLFAVAGALYQFRFHHDRKFRHHHSTPTTAEEKKRWYQQL